MGVRNALISSKFGFNYMARKKKPSTKKRRKKKKAVECYVCEKKTKLYRCHHCERYFCKKHSRPIVPSLADRHASAHGCPQYRNWLWDQEKLDLKKRRNSLNRLKAITPPRPRKRKDEDKDFSLEFRPQSIEFETSKKKIPVFKILILLALLATVWYFYKNPDLLKNIPSLLKNALELN